jgi:hypothetical protein
LDNPEKLETQGTQDEEKQNKNTTQYVPDTTIRTQTKIMYKIVYYVMWYNRIVSVMVRVFASSAVDRGFETRSGQPKDNEICISVCCF